LIVSQEEAFMDEIRHALRDFILHEFLPGEDPGELTDETPLITGGILDSISTLKLVTFLEEHFGITVEAYEAGIDHLDSVGQIAQLIAAKKQAA
jgi:acyl carrier protein